MKIIETAPSAPYFEHFERFPASLYSNVQQAWKKAEGWSRTHFAKAYLLMDGSEVLARAALYDNPSLYLEGKKAACIGNYECIDDAQVATFFLEELSQRAKALGDYLIGPMNGSTWDNYRLSVHHDAPPVFLEPYHHLYYNDHFLGAGFQCIAKYFSSKDTTLKHDKTAILERKADFEAKGITFRMVTQEEFDDFLERLYPFVLEAFQTNYLYTPISKEDFLAKYAPVKRLIVPEFLMIAEDAQGVLRCFFFCLPDYWNTSEKHLIIKTIARHPGEQWRGLGHVLSNEIYRNAVKKGYTTVIHAFMKEEGYSKTISRNFSGEVFKNYALYGKVL